MGLFGRPHTIFGRVRIVEAMPHSRKGTPALAGYLGTNTPEDRREHTDCRVGNFPKARTGFWGGSQNPVADGDVDFGRDGSARNVGAFPGRDLRSAESGCFPGREYLERGRRLFPGRTLIVVY